MYKISIKYYTQKRRAEEKRKGEDVRLLMSLHFDGKRLIHYPGVYLLQHQWDKEIQEVQNRADSEGLNVFLNALKIEAEKLYNELKIKYGTVEFNQLREKLSDIKVIQRYDLSQALTHFIKDQYLNWSQATYFKFKTLYKSLYKYENTKNLNLSLESADSKFLLSYKNFLHREGLKSSTITNYLNNLKWFLNFCFKKKWMLNSDYRSFKNIDSKSHVITAKKINFLNHVELKKLCEPDIENRKQEQCRDIFCFIAYTGVRFNEVNNLKKESFKGMELSVEGRRARVIPMNSTALMILEKYKNRYFKSNSLFPVYSIITVNKYLGSVFSNLGISPNSLIENPDYKVSIALAFNSFMANAVHFGISPAIVRKWSDNKTLSRYLSVKNSIDQEEQHSIDIINQNYG